MDNSDYSRNRHNDHLGVNKIGKNIRKSPLHQPNFAILPRPQSQPQVYNINKSDFRNIVQQLTGSPAHHSQEPLPRPPLNPPKPASIRLQRIRPPPLSPININRPRMVLPQNGPRGGPRAPLSENTARPAHYGQPPPRNMVPPPPMSSGDHIGWANTAESPISAYMRYLQHSINDGNLQAHPQIRSNMQQQSSGLLPLPPLPSPRTSGAPPIASPTAKGYHPPLPSPTWQFLLQSPSGYLNLPSPRSPYPLLSPGFQVPPPLTPNLPFSPMDQAGILGPGPPPPPSPGISFPLSPGFFAVSSPRWRD